MSENRWDIVVHGARIFDGTGAASFAGSLAVRGDRIAAIGEVEGASALEIDARGLALAPGFIDVHSHDDFAVLTTPTMDFKLMQGVTTEVVGNCGMGAAPYEALRDHFGTFFGNMATTGWQGYRGYLEMVERAPPSLNVAMLVAPHPAHFRPQDDDLAEDEEDAGQQHRQDHGVELRRVLEDADQVLVQEVGEPRHAGEEP